MNARDKIKPKTIRMAILMALSDGAIVTIDDLQSKTDEPRTKIATNVYPAAIEGLIKRLRDDVTGAPAYQITSKGREYLRSFEVKKEEADSPAPVVKKSKTAGIDGETADNSPEVKADERISDKAAEIIGFKEAEIAELTDKYAAAVESINEFRCIADEIKGWRYVANLFGLSTANDVEERIRELALMVTKYTPTGYVLQRPAKPLVRFNKVEKARVRALSFAKSGQRVQVFAMAPIGEAVPGAEWMPK